MTSSTRWSLTEDAFERLLERLGPDREEAGERYESLRARLVDYFDWKGVLRPDAACDETLDRVARRLEEGESIQRVEAYVHGVARYVLLESLRQQTRERQDSASVPLELIAQTEGDEEVRIECLTRCLQELAAADRDLIVGYYEGAGDVHLSGRKRLAARLGISYATLKTRAHRLRNRLDACLRGCLEESDR